MTGEEFKKLFEQHNEVCVLAQALLNESVYTTRDLFYTKEFIRDKFINEAERLIKNLNDHDLEIIHRNKMNEKNI